MLLHNHSIEREWIVCIIYIPFILHLLFIRYNLKYTFPDFRSPVCECLGYVYSLPNTDPVLINNGLAL